MSVWLCGAWWQPYDRRKPNRLVTLQIGDAANVQVVFPAYGATDGECDHLICILMLVTNLMKGNKLGVVVKGSADRSENRLAEALIAVDNARALVTRFREVHKIVPPNFNEETF